MAIIYHLVPETYHRAQLTSQPYLPETFAAEGFIHCTGELTALVAIANAFLADVTEPLRCYHIDTERLTAPVHWEPPAPVVGAENTPAPVDTLFPHIYGAINREAIVGITTLIRAKDGTWQLPPNFDERTHV